MVSPTSAIFTQVFIQLQHLPGSALAQAAEQDVQMARQFFGGPTTSSAPSLALTSPSPHTELSRFPEVSARFDLNQVWARGIPQQPQPAFRDNVARVPWASELTGVHNQAIPGSSAQQPGQQISDGMYSYQMFTLVQSLRPNQQVQRPYTSLGIPYNYSMPTTMYGSSLIGPASYQSFNPALHTMSSDKGKARAQDADFDAAFAQAAASLRITDTDSSARIVELETSSTAVEPVSEDAKASAEFSELVFIFFN